MKKKKSKQPSYDLKPLQEFLTYDSPKGIAKQLREAVYLLCQYSLSDLAILSGIDIGEAPGYYHNEIPGGISILHHLADALEEIKEVQPA